MDFSDLKTKGVIVLYNGQPHEVIWSQFVRMQQRKPVIQTKLRNLISGKVLDYSFKSGEKVEEAEVTKQAAQFLYADETGANFMNNESYETVALSKAIMEDKLGYLKEGEQVILRYFDGAPISIELPIKVELKVKETPPGVRGDTSGGGTKPAILETGMTINVPLFIKEGDSVRINTQTGEYVERAN
jgi:elongation factor P